MHNTPAPTTAHLYTDGEGGSSQTPPGANQRALTACQSWPSADKNHWLRRMPDQGNYLRCITGTRICEDHAGQDQTDNHARSNNHLTTDRTLITTYT